VVSDLNGVVGFTFPLSPLDKKNVYFCKKSDVYLALGGLADVPELKLNKSNDFIKEHFRRKYDNI